MATEADGELVRHVLSVGQAVLERQDSGVRMKDMAGTFLAPDFEQALREGDIDVGLRVMRYERPTGNFGTETIELALVTTDKGTKAEDYVRDRLTLANQVMLLSGSATSASARANRRS